MLLQLKPHYTYHQYIAGFMIDLELIIVVIFPHHLIHITIQLSVLILHFVPFYVGQSIIVVREVHILLVFDSKNSFSIPF